MITSETYKLDRHACGKPIVLPADTNEQRCPLCGAPISIQWAAARAEISGKGGPDHA